MTDKPSPGEEEEQELPAAHDELLERWVAIADTTGVGIAVSLTLGGMLISGSIMKRSEYMRKFAADLRRGLEEAGFGEEAGRIGGVFMERADSLDRENEERNKRQDETLEAEEDGPKYRYIHLSNANIFLSAGQEPFRANYWRGRLSAVTGWIFGKLDTRPGQ